MGKTEMLSTRIFSVENFSAFCWKIATSCSS